MLRECTSDGGRESCSTGSAGTGTQFQLQPQRRERGSYPCRYRERAHALWNRRELIVSSDAESVVSAPEADPSGREAHELREFFSWARILSTQRGARERRDAMSTQENTMTAIAEAVCALGRQARGVQGDAWALLAEASHDWGKCGASVPRLMGTLMREV